MNVDTTQKLSKDKRYKVGRNITVLGSIGNLILTIFKFIAGVLGNSQAMIADAVHSLSDFGTDIVVIIGLRFTRKPEDKKHPYGHGRAETFSTLIVGVVLFLMGINILKEAISTIIAGKFNTPGFIALLAAVISIIIKEILYQFTKRAADRINSTSLKANAWHHRTDALSSVAALIGISAAMIKQDWLIFDPLAAGVVSLIVLKTSIEILIEVFQDFMESAADEETIQKIHHHASNVQNVLNAHEIKTRKVGNDIFVDLHIEINPMMTVTEGHDIAREVRNQIKENVQNIGDVLVHIEPKDHKTTEELRQQNKEKTEKIIQISESINGVRNIHDVVINNRIDEVSVELHAVVNPEMKTIESHRLADEIERIIINQMDIDKVIVHIDPYDDTYTKQ